MSAASERAEPVVRVEECDDWQAWKALRLEALADTPIGYGELLADALVLADEDWAARLARPGLRLLAYAGDGPTPEAPVGMAGGFRRDDGTPVLVAVYLQPAVRGQGILAALADAVAAWCAPDVLTLDVHEDNHRAHAAYLKLGFVETGVRTPGGGIDGRDLVAMHRL